MIKVSAMLACNEIDIAFKDILAQLTWKIIT